MNTFTEPARVAALLGLALVSALLFASAAAARAHASDHRTLVLDAQLTTRTSGPGPNQVGHLQLQSGNLRDAHGHLVGRFHSTCRWIAILPNNDAKEHCSGSGRTSEGRIQFAGNTRESQQTNTFAITHGSDSYRGVRGIVAARTLSPHEALLTVTLSLTSTSTLRVGVVPRPAANRSFRTHANTFCGQAAARLAKLPSFPLNNFDPTHPTTAQLRKVGQYFTGPGDPRPILRRLDQRLHNLGQPPADRPNWQKLLTARKAGMTVRNEQDKAALAGNTRRFIASLRDVNRAARNSALAAALFGTPACSI